MEIFFSFSVFFFFFSSFACLFSAKLNFAPIAFSHCLWLFLYRCCCCCWFLFLQWQKRQHQLNWNDLIGFFFSSLLLLFSFWVCVLCLSRLKPLSLSVSFPNLKAKNSVAERWQREKTVQRMISVVCVIKTHQMCPSMWKILCFNYML